MVTPAPGRLRELRFDMAAAAAEADPVDVQVRRAGGEVVFHKTLTRSGGPTFTMLVALPLGKVVVEAWRSAVLTHRADITVGSKLDDSRRLTVPRVR